MICAVAFLALGGPDRARSLAEVFGHYTYHTIVVFVDMLGSHRT